MIHEWMIDEWMGDEWMIDEWFEIWVNVRWVKWEINEW